MTQTLVKIKWIVYAKPSYVRNTYHVDPLVIIEKKVVWKDEEKPSVSKGKDGRVVHLGFYAHTAPATKEKSTSSP